MAEAARVAAMKPTQHVLFRAACKVDAPQRPGAVKPLPPLVGRRRVPAQPAKKDAPDIPLEDKLWRLRSKRAWVCEQLRALRGFPKDSAYDEPWTDAFEMVQAMGGGLNLQTGLPGDVSDADEDGFSSDSELHEQLLFDEEPLKHHALSKTGAALDSGTETSAALSNSTPSTGSPAAGNHAAATTKAGANASALSSAFQGSNQPTTIVGCAQELMRHQRSIELDAERAWQATLQARKPAAAAQRLLLRNDSAYEVPHKGGPGATNKAKGTHNKGGAQWVGEMLPAAEFDADSEVTCAMILVTDERSGASRTVLRSKTGQSEAQMVEEVKQQAAMIARLHGLDKPMVQLVRAGTMQWGIT